MKNQGGYRQKPPFYERMYRFMYGRNGVDELSKALLVVYVILLLINVFLRSWILSLATLAVATYMLFRIFSRNVYRRRRENQWYYKRYNRVRSFFRLRKSKWRDRKTHIYRKCPQCKNNLRLPKIKGRHTVNCPCCHNRFDVKV